MVWRETSAVHFNTDDGYFDPELILTDQKTRKACCVSSLELNSTRSRQRSNGLVVPFMKILIFQFLRSGRPPSCPQDSATLVRELTVSAS